MVSELLTVREVQDLLKLDRITVYRMLKDGRLSGVKIGHQWRFSRQELDALLCNVSPQSSPQPAALFSVDPPAAEAARALPLHCVQIIQDVFAEVAGVSAVTTDMQGVPVTQISNSPRFCELIRSTEPGRNDCLDTWKRLARQSNGVHFLTCEAGLQHAAARIALSGEPVAVLSVGHFYASAPDPVEEAERVRALARHYGLDPEELVLAARDLPVLDERKRQQIGRWLSSVASTFEQIGKERVELMSRLRTIAAMSTLEPV